MKKVLSLVFIVFVCQSYSQTTNFMLDSCLTYSFKTYPKQTFVNSSYEAHNQAWFYSIADDNLLLKNKPTYNNLFLSYNYGDSLYDYADEGLFYKKDALGFKRYLIKPNNFQMSINNMTQSGENVLLSGAQYYDNTHSVQSVGGWMTHKPYLSDGIIISTNNFLNNGVNYDIINVKLNSIKGSLSNVFVYVNDVFKLNNGEIIALGTITYSRLLTFGNTFILHLDNNYNVKKFYLNNNLNSNFEKIVYDPSNNLIFAVGRNGNGSMVVRYNPTNNSILSKFSDGERFFDIKKYGNDLVLGECEGHYHWVKLLHLDNNLNIKNSLKWDNHSIDTNLNGSPKYFFFKPMSIVVNEDNIFIYKIANRNINGLFGGMIASKAQLYNSFIFKTLLSDTQVVGYNLVGLEKSYNMSENYTMHLSNGAHPWHQKSMILWNNKIVCNSGVGFPNQSLANSLSSNSIKIFNNLNINSSLVGKADGETCELESAYFDKEEMHKMPNPQNELYTSQVFQEYITQPGDVIKTLNNFTPSNAVLFDSCITKSVKCSDTAFIYYPLLSFNYCDDWVVYSVSEEYIMFINSNGEMYRISKYNEKSPYFLLCNILNYPYNILDLNYESPIFNWYYNNFNIINNNKTNVFIVGNEFHIYKGGVLIGRYNNYDEEYLKQIVNSFAYCDLVIEYNDQLNLYKSRKENISLSYKVYDNIGNLIYTEKETTKERSSLIQELKLKFSKGLYFIETNTNGNILREKFIF